MSYVPKWINSFLSQSLKNLSLPIKPLTMRYYLSRTNPVSDRVFCHVKLLSLIAKNFLSLPS